MGPGLPTLAAPFPSHPGRVRPEWIDANGHLNLAYYVVLFDLATDALWEPLGLGPPFRAAGSATFAVETHTLYLAELREGDDTACVSVVLGADRKRLHVSHELLRAGDGAVAARQELIFLCVDLATRRSAPWPTETLSRLQAAAAAHARLHPPWIGRRCLMPTPA